MADINNTYSNHVVMRVPANILKMVDLENLGTYSNHVVVCIPAYNVERTIHDVVERCLKYADKVVVCDDGSTDFTLVEAEKAGAIVIQHLTNKGKGVALHTLFEYTKELPLDVMVTIDGDGQFLPEEIPKMIQPILDKTTEIVIGYRFDDKAEMPSYRKFGNKFFDKITKLTANLPFRDTQSGFRAYSKKAIDSISFSTSGFGVDSEILIDAVKKNLHISEEKITVIYNTGGKTSTKNPVSHSADIFGSLLEYVALRRPLKFLGIPGLVFFVIGVVYSIVVIAIFNDTRYFSIPSTLIALGSIVIGLVLVMMSIVLFAIQRSLKR
jgi:glycosyltransferase involved in cell wall biosynthesis